MLWSERKRLWCGLPWTFTKYSFDEDKLYVDRGFLNQRQDEVRWYRVLDISFTRSFMQRIFGLSTIHLSTADRSLGNFDIKNIRRGREIKNQISDLIEIARTGKNIRTREYISADMHEDDCDDMG